MNCRASWTPDKLHGSLHPSPRKRSLRCIRHTECDIEDLTKMEWGLEGGLEAPFLNFEGGPGVPLLNLRRVPDPTFKLWGGSRVLGSQVPGSWSHFYTMPPALIKKYYKYIECRDESRNPFISNIKHFVIKQTGKSLTVNTIKNFHILDSWIWWYIYKSLKHQNKLTAHFLIFNQVTSFLNAF